MTPETAAQAAQLLLDINAMKGKVDNLEMAIENSHFVAGGPLATDDPALPIDLPLMTPEESKEVFNAVLSVLQARMDAMTRELSEL